MNWYQILLFTSYFFIRVNLSQELHVSAQRSAACSYSQAHPLTREPPHNPPPPQYINGRWPLLSLKPWHAGRWFISYEWKIQMKVHSCLSSERKQLAPLVSWCPCYTYVSRSGEFGIIWQRMVRGGRNTFRRRNGIQEVYAQRILWRCCHATCGCCLYELQIGTKEELKLVFRWRARLKS